MEQGKAYATVRPDRRQEGAVEGELHERLSAGPWAPAVARDAVAEWLGDRPQTDDVILATSELVTNAVRHGGSDIDHIELHATQRDNVIRVSVTQRDGPDRLPPATLPPATEEQGRGLPIVHVISDRWGVDAHAGMTVWFEVNLRERRN